MGCVLDCMGTDEKCAASITLFSLLSFTVLSSGCAVTLKSIQPVARTSGGVTVALKEHAGDLFKLEVYNATAAPIVVDRDAIMLQRDGQKIGVEPIELRVD